MSPILITRADGMHRMIYQFFCRCPESLVQINATSCCEPNSYQSNFKCVKCQKQMILNREREDFHIKLKLLLESVGLQIEPQITGSLHW